MLSAMEILEMTAPRAGPGAGLQSTWATMIMFIVKLTIVQQQEDLPSTWAMMITLKMTIVMPIVMAIVMTIVMTILMTARTTGAVFPHSPLGKPGLASLMTPTGWNSKRFSSHHQSCFWSWLSYSHSSNWKGLRESGRHRLDVGRGCGEERKRRSSWGNFCLYHRFVCRYHILIKVSLAC